MIKPSKYQKAVFDFIEKGEGNAVINAVAGSGKTTTINIALSKVSPDQECLLLAFNKSIVDELKTRVSDKENVTVSTLHSLGHRAIIRQFNVEVDAHKYSRFVNTYFDTDRNLPDGLVDREEISIFKQNIKRLIDLGRVNLCNNETDLHYIANKFEIILVGNEIHFAMRFIKWGLLKEDVIDFTDMIYWPVVKKLWVRRYHWVFIDECQDLNAAQRKLFLMSLRTDGRFLAVGDPHQAIYGFAGADVQSFNILASLPYTKVYPLSVCYRCDESIIQLAKKFVPSIEARPGVPKGMIDYEADPMEAKPGDLVLSRFNRPLMDQCLTYLRNGIKANIQGKDIGANLAKMISDTKLDLMNDVIEKLYRDYDKACAKYASKMKISLIEAEESNYIIDLRDKIETIEILSSGFDLKDEVIRKIHSIFSDNKTEGILLSTIHKSKGLEAERVYILEADNMMSGYALNIEWSAEQEYNLQYVAYTRAKHYLGLVK